MGATHQGIHQLPFLKELIKLDQYVDCLFPEEITNKNLFIFKEEYNIVNINWPFYKKQILFKLLNENYFHFNANNQDTQPNTALHDRIYQHLKLLLSVDIKWFNFFLLSNPQWSALKPATKTTLFNKLNIFINPKLYSRYLSDCDNPTKLNQLLRQLNDEELFDLFYFHLSQDFYTDDCAALDLIYQHLNTLDTKRLANILFRPNILTYNILVPYNNIHPKAFTQLSTLIKKCNDSK